jgi:xanthine/uracil/vitamin C permease (AzgA family)
LAIWIRDKALRVTVVCHILAASPVLDIVAVHDAVDSTGRSLLTVVLHAMSELPLFTFAMALVNVTASVKVSPVLVEVGMEVVVLRAIRPRLVRVVSIDLLLNGGEFVVYRSIGSTARMSC